MASMIVQVKLFGTVVVGEIDVRPAIAVEIGRRRGKRPPRTAHPHLVGDVFELPAAEVVE
jgi:hypothetical protein